MSKRARTSRSQSQNASQLSQTRLVEHLTQSQFSIDDAVNNCVRYIVYNGGQNAYFRKADIQKHCAPRAGHFLQQVIEKTTRILEQVYGYKLLVCDQTATSGKGFIVTNALPYKNYNLDQEEPDIKDCQKILLLLILSHIFMSNVATPEASLHAFLEHFEIDVNVRHPIFGSVKDYISTLIKQKYLATETDPVTKKISYSWGIRSEAEISKHAILSFVCKVYKDRQPKSWTNQYKVANEQHLENDNAD
ncbi:melanoma-associated antigen D2 [Tribolium castaneum]|uniref:Trophinin-like Protein n=1 Tax=Tribolium castaneum TaxID=7070 RepID=D6WWD1_TRICA|nr:PREDICTED: melanoma-associated antigen D2 [Tribolium castaneum]EFA08692.1 Trophinin-like Protein [Tribolium castaneum]|eukprot:XP_008196776.2 PREDICTED: melanoma-associated antigen D2 [Tribolium castaneum]